MTELESLINWRESARLSIIACEDPDMPNKVLKLLEIVEIQNAALEFYASGAHIWRESEDRPQNVCPPIGSHAKEAREPVKKILEAV